jgi:hypothetical protein
MTLLLIYVCAPERSDGKEEVHNGDDEEYRGAIKIQKKSENDRQIDSSQHVSAKLDFKLRTCRGFGGVK